MFGSLRFLLSLGVVISHLWAGLSHWSAVYAVFGFFVLSGYLMTLVLHETYGFSVRGQLRYLANRAMRIFPLYWLVLGLALAVAMTVTAPDTQPIRVFIPDGAPSWMANLFIFGLDNGAVKIIPPAWTLNTEFIFYIAMGVFLSRSRASVLAWAAASLGYTAWLVAQGSGFESRYYAILPATLPFSLGALIFMLKRGSNLRLPRWLIGTIALVFCIHLFQADHIWGRDALFLEGFYVSLMLAALTVFALAGLRLPGRWARIDRFLGDISYPVFLVHWAIGSFAVALFGMKSGGGLFFASLPVIMLVSVVLHRFAEVPVNRIRDTIRAGKLRVTAAPATATRV